MTEGQRPGLNPLSNGNKSENQAMTWRFTLTLTDSTDKTFPEFSFSELIQNTAGDKEKESWDENESDSLRALARKFELKYGPKPGKIKRKDRRKDRIQDLIDLSLGYDEADPFVDNSVAYDELIPAELTTQYGGFYINSGQLEFKAMQSSSDESDTDDFKIIKFKKTPKVQSEKLKVTKVKKHKDKVQGEIIRKKKIADKEKKIKRVKLCSVEKKPNKKATVLGSNAVFTPPSSHQTSPSGSLTAAMNGNIERTSKENIQNGVLLHEKDTDIIMKNIDELSSDMIHSSSSNSPNAKQNNSMEHSSPNQSEESANPSSNTVDVTLLPKLPPELPQDIMGNIDKLKSLSQESADGKCKFFDSAVNKVLLEIETKSRELGSKIRSGIYEYLSFYVPCTKETLLKRAKKLLVTEQEQLIKEPLSKLKEAIELSMPKQIERFEEEVKLHLEEHATQSMNGDKTSPAEESNKEEALAMLMVVDEDASDKNDDPATPGESNASSTGEEKSKKNMPRRKFTWTDELRELLCNVVQIKVEVFELSKTRASSAEDYLKSFFESEVKPLWPKGWMNSRILLKESKSVHARITCCLNKTKKVPVKRTITSIKQLSGKNSPVPAASTPTEPIVKIEPTTLLHQSGNSNQGTPATSSTIPSSTTPSTNAATPVSTSTPSLSSILQSISSMQGSHASSNPPSAKSTSFQFTATSPSIIGMLSAMQTSTPKPVPSLTPTNSLNNTPKTASNAASTSQSVSHTTPSNQKSAAHNDQSTVSRTLLDYADIKLGDLGYNACSHPPSQPPKMFSCPSTPPKNASDTVTTTSTPPRQSPSRIDCLGNISKQASPSATPADTQSLLANYLKPSSLVQPMSIPVTCLSSHQKDLILAAKQRSGMLRSEEPELIFSSSKPIIHATAQGSTSIPLLTAPSITSAKLPHSLTHVPIPFAGQFQPPQFLLNPSQLAAQTSSQIASHDHSYLPGVPHTQASDSKTFTSRFN